MLIPQQHHHHPPPPAASSFLHHYILSFLTKEFLPKGMVVGSQVGWKILAARRPGKPQKPTEHTCTCRELSCAVLP